MRVEDCKKRSSGSDGCGAWQTWISSTRSTRDLVQELVRFICGGAGDTTVTNSCTRPRPSSDLAGGMRKRSRLVLDGSEEASESRPSRTHEQSFRWKKIADAIAQMKNYISARYLAFVYGR